MGSLTHWDQARACPADISTAQPSTASPATSCCTLEAAGSVSAAPPLALRVPPACTPLHTCPPKPVCQLHHSPAVLPGMRLSSQPGCGRGCPTQMGAALPGTGHCVRAVTVSPPRPGWIQQTARAVTLRRPWSLTTGPSLVPHCQVPGCSNITQTHKTQILVTKQQTSLPSRVPAGPARHSWPTANMHSHNHAMEWNCGPAEGIAGSVL